MSPSTSSGQADQKPELGFNTPFAEQIAFLRQKLNIPTERWDDIMRAAHDRGFIVAGAMKADLLTDLHDAVNRVAAEGKSIGWFRDNFQAIVTKHGWHGWTGEGTAAGEAWRTKVIYQTNLNTSYAAGRYAQLTEPDYVTRYPYWRYKHMDGVANPRLQHVAWNGLILPHDHPFWQTHFPPNGWGCRCKAFSVSAKEYERAAKSGLPELPEGWDERDDKGNLPGVARGFDYAPGASLQQLSEVLTAKADNLSGSAPRAIVNQIKAELQPSTVLKMPGIDPDLITDLSQLKRAEHYINAIRPSILPEIAEGGIRGNAALVHELTEVAALREAGLNVYDPDAIAQIVAAFDMARKTGDPQAHIPWHLLALRAEIDYAKNKLTARGIEASASEVARGLYGVEAIMSRKMEKMVSEMDAIGEPWPLEAARQEIIDALSVPYRLR